MQTLYNRFIIIGGNLARPVKMSDVIGIPELKYNPFRYRIGKVFARMTGQLNTVNPGEENANLSPYDLLKKASQDVNLYQCDFATFLQILNVFSPRYV